ncbi:YfiR family protein [Amphritea sp.]|uniref:YfiR family protein n=1 Tax=Amphritea sp. TaxID=1872502 RepID=UPI0025C01954|nr:YfiR family protein [Amphritea sp.]
MNKALNFLLPIYYRRKLTLLILLICIYPLNLQANTQEYKLQQVKAAILYNIAKFVRWPEHAIAETPDTLTICHYRENNLNLAFLTISGKKVQRRRVNEKLIDTLDDAKHCAMLLIPFNQLQWFADDQADHGPLPILTVADLTETNPSQVENSKAAVNLIRKGKRIGLDIFLPEVTRNGLTISSELLKLARIRR